MPWTAPKTDWAVTDVFAHTDANRIEENINYLNDAFDGYKKYDVERRDVHLSGFAVSAITIDRKAEKILQQVTVNVPDTGNLNLLLVRCAGFDPTYVRIRVQVDDADVSEIYTGPSGAFDTTEYPSGGSVKLLYQNNTGSTVAKTLSISAYNSANDSKEIAAGGGWEIKCGITLPTDY